MNFDDLIEVLRKVNHGRPDPVDEELLRKIVALVIKNPLDEDRAHCQEQLALIISQHIPGKQNAD